MATSSYKFGLGPKIPYRARLILGSLLLVCVLFVVVGIYQGVASGAFEKVLIKPFRDFGADFNKAMTATPVPLPTLTPVVSPTTSTSTSTSTSKVIINQTAPIAPKVQAPVISDCSRYNIREGEFASNKCYSSQDYEDLSYYLNKYNSAVSRVSFYETEVRISCGNDDFFKTCEQDKKDQQANLDNIPQYKATIQEIIARGK